MTALEDYEHIRSTDPSPSGAVARADLFIADAAIEALKHERDTWRAVAGRLVVDHCPDHIRDCDSCLADLYFEEE